jgi:F-type H+-transporting ATPase subunit epsilon
VPGTFPLEIVTPTRILYNGDVAMVRAPGTQGSFQVFPGHTPLISTLEIGEIDVRLADGTERAIATSGGFVEVLRTGVTVLAETAEFAEEIDRKRAEEAVDRAKQLLEHRRTVERVASDAAKHDAGMESEKALLRAINRLRVAGRSQGT